MYVIVGLGNPDKKYEHTRHNIGFDVIDALADKYNISVTDKKHKALCGSGVIEGMKVLLVKPQTYMNLSGESVAEVMNFYKLDPDEEMIVIFDDISLEPGRIRIRKKGSAGGHNGIKSIIAMTGTTHKEPAYAPPQTTAATHNEPAQAETTTTQARVYSIKLTTEFEYNDVQIKIGEHTQLRAEVKPDNAVNKNVKWESNRPDIATVDSNGRVTAVAKGKAIISAVTEDKGLQASCMVTVKE